MPEKSYEENSLLLTLRIFKQNSSVIKRFARDSASAFQVRKLFGTLEKQVPDQS